MQVSKTSILMKKIPQIGILIPVLYPLKHGNEIWIFIEEIKKWKMMMLARKRVRIFMKKDKHIFP